MKCTMCFKEKLRIGQVYCGKCLEVMCAYKQYKKRCPGKNCKNKPGWYTCTDCWGKYASFFEEKMISCSFYTGLYFIR